MYRYIVASTIEILNIDVTNHKTFKFYYKDLYSEGECVLFLIFILCLEISVNMEVLLNPVERIFFFLLLSLPTLVSTMSILR